MALNYAIPSAATPFLNENGEVRPSWYLFLSSVLQTIGGPAVIPNNQGIQPADIQAQFEEYPISSTEALEALKAVDELRNEVAQARSDAQILRAMIDELQNSIAAIPATPSTYVRSVNGVSSGDGNVTISGSEISGVELTANKDASGGYAGLTLYKINFKNALNTFTSFFANANTAARNYTFQDRDGTIADLGSNIFAAVQTINQNSGSLTNGSFTSGLHIGGADSTQTGIFLDAFAAAPTIAGRRANTSNASKSNVASGNTLLNIQAQGYGSTGYLSGKATILFIATQDWTDSASGSKLTFNTTPNGSTTQTLAVTIDNDQSVTIANKLTLLGGATFLTTSSALTDGAGVGAGTLLTAPAAGNPTKWIGINDNGTTRYIPSW